MRAPLTYLVTFSSWRRGVAIGRKAPKMSRSFSLLVVGKLRVKAAFDCGENIASRVCVRVNVLQTRVCVCVCVCLLLVCVHARLTSVRTFLLESYEEFYDIYIFFFEIFCLPTDPG